MGDLNDMVKAMLHGAIGALIAASLILWIGRDVLRTINTGLRSLEKRRAELDDAAWRIEARSTRVEQRANDVERREREIMEVASRREENVAKSLRGLVILGDSPQGRDPRGVRSVFYDGERIENIKRVEIIIDAGQSPEVSLEMHDGGSLRQVTMHQVPKLVAPHAEAE